MQVGASRHILSAFLIVLGAGQFFAQDGEQTTIKTKTVAATETKADHKVLIIPFEPRLYNSEIDRSINAETKLSAKDIKYKFRDGLNEQLYKALRASKYNAVDFMSDTVLYKKELASIYQYLTYDYVKVPDQKNYKVPSREKEQKKIENGQLVVETNSDARFMDARITNAKALQAIQAKYRSDLFLFINELDIKAGGTADPGAAADNSGMRKIIVHYTIMNSSGVEINSGTVEEEFDPSLNIPKKIIDKHFSKIAVTLLQRMNKALGPKK